MNYIKKFVIPAIVAVFIIILLAVLRTVPVSKLWKGYSVLYVPNGTEPGIVLNTLQDNGCKDVISYYKENAKIIANAMEELNIWYTGGKNSPYIWLKCPNNLSSWDFFDKLLNEANVVGTPGSGFGKNGNGFFRLTAFGERENIIGAVEQIKKFC